MGSTQLQSDRRIRGPFRAGAVALGLLVLGVSWLGALTAAGASHGPQRFHAPVDQVEAEGLRTVLVALTGQAEKRAVGDSVAGPGSGFADAEVVHRYRRLPILLVEAGTQALRELARDDRVVSLEPDELMAPALDATASLIGADAPPASSFDGSGTAVAILDSGIDGSHPFFGSRIAAEACFSNAAGAGTGTTLCPGEGNAESGPGAADVGIPACGGGHLCGHGTHIVGVALGDGQGLTGAPERGIAPGADVVAIQVFTRFDHPDNCTSEPPCVRTYTSDYIRGLEHVLELAGSLDSELVAANLSLGNTAYHTEHCDDSSVKVAIDELIETDVATVISAGNQGRPHGVNAPACISTAVTVGATDNADGLPGFTNRGSLVDLMAPGVGVDSSVVGGSFASWSGTSISAPHVAGAWAIMREAVPGAGVDDVLDCLQDGGVGIAYGGVYVTPRLRLSGEPGVSGALAACGLGAVAAADPRELDFGGVMVGEASPTEAIEVSSAGDEAVEIADVGLSGPDASDFLVAEDGCTGLTLSPGESCEVLVRMEPTGRGPRAGSIEIASDDNGSPLAIPLLGVGKPTELVQRLRVPRTQGSARRLVGELICRRSDCTATTRGKLRIRLASGKARAFNLARTVSDQRAGARRRIRWQIPRRARRPIRRAMRGGRAVRARVGLRVVGAEPQVVRSPRRRVTLRP